MRFSENGATRKIAAEKLLERLKRGPQISTPPGDLLSAEDFNRRYRRWFESWIESDLMRLIPELRKNGGST